VAVSADSGTPRRGVERSALGRAVGLASIAYLALPVGVLLAGWLRPAWGGLAVLTLFAGVVGWTRRLGAAAGASVTGPPVPGATLGGAALAVIGISALSGAGGFGVQTWDWQKHNAILRDLVAQPWPVVYATGRDDAALTYYVAYHLPAALAGKLAGWTAANVAVFAWTASGAVLAMLWLVVLSAAPVGRCLALFALFSGLDLVGAALWSSRWAGTGWLHDFHVEWWAGTWEYAGNLTLLAHAPNQALGAWLLTGLALDGLRRGRADHPHALGGALGLLWSPLATVGLAALAALDYATSWRARRGWRRLARDGSEISGLVVGLVLALYLASRAWPVALPARDYPPAAALRAGEVAFVPNLLGWPRFVADYAMFNLLEWMLLALVLATLHRDSREDRRLLGVAAATLLALPFLRYGYFNDLVMRGSIPALFTLAVLSARALDGSRRRRGLVGLLVGVLALGALYPANMLRLQVKAAVQRGALVRIVPSDAVSDLFALQRRIAYYFFVGQYLGGLDSPFFRYLARPPVPVPLRPGSGP
jgi:hypothetical protein